MNNMMNLASLLIERLNADGHAGSLEKAASATEDPAVADELRQHARQWRTSAAKAGRQLEACPVVWTEIERFKS